MNNSQVAHKWANEAAPQATGSNFYFRGDALYSYGPHFVVGRIVRNKAKRRAYLLNAGSYSPSTGRHQSYARRAIASGSTVFHVADPSASHDTNRASYKTRMASALANVPGARSARTLRHALGQAAEMAVEYNEYSTFYALRGRIKVPALNAADTARLARYDASDVARTAACAARNALSRAEREAADAIRCAEARNKFREGAPRTSYVGGPCMLRLNGDIFQTSQGADVPRADGIAMLAHIAQTLRAAHNGDVTLPVQYFGPSCPMAGGFTLRSISAGEVTIGCHHIPMAECVAMAALVGISWPS